MLTETAEERQEYRHVWVVAEQADGVVKDVTFELLGAARTLAEPRAMEVWCVLLGHGLDAAAAQCIQYRADRVLVVDDQALERFADDTYAAVLVRLVRQYRPETILCGATTYGRALSPRVAVTLNTGLTADCTGLDIEPETGNLLQIRPAFGGNIMATIKTPRHRPQMATVRPRVMTKPEPDPARQGEIIRETLRAVEKSARTRVLDATNDSEGAATLADARVIVAGGRGVRGKEGFELLKRFAAVVGGAVGASRAAVDAGWIDYAHQIGQTGQTVQPRVYIACGVSGQVQHLVGMQSATVIIAINKDRDAPIMQLADYAVVGDLFEILPALAAELGKL